MVTICALSEDKSEDIMNDVESFLAEIIMKDKHKK